MEDLNDNHQVSNDSIEKLNEDVPLNLDFDIDFDQFNELWGDDQDSDTTSSSTNQQSSSDDTKCNSQNSEIISTRETIYSPLTSHQTSRWSSLLNLASQISRSINSADETLLSQVIQDNFLVNCNMKVPALSIDLQGCQAIFNYFISVTRGIPDLLTHCHKLQIKGNVINVPVTAYGTRIDINEPDETWDNLQYGQSETDGLNESRREYKLLRKTGRPVNIKSVSCWHFILNKEMTYVETYVSTLKSVIVSESSITNLMPTSNLLSEAPIQRTSVKRKNRKLRRNT
jgi:hypothetical protein